MTVVTPQTATIVHVLYQLAGTVVRRGLVALTPGYTTEADIPSLLTYGSRSYTEQDIKVLATVTEEPGQPEQAEHDILIAWACSYGADAAALTDLAEAHSATDPAAADDFRRHAIDFRSTATDLRARAGAILAGVIPVPPRTRPTGL